MFAGSRSNVKSPCLGFLRPPCVHPLCWRGPWKLCRCSLHHSYEPHLQHLSSPSFSNSSSFIETNRLEVAPGRGDHCCWMLRSTQSEEFSFVFKTPCYSIGGNRTQFPPGWEHESPLGPSGGLLNPDVQTQCDAGSVAMKMFPLWLTFSACSTCFILKGVQAD